MPFARLQTSVRCPLSEELNEVNRHSLHPIATLTVLALHPIAPSIGRLPDHDISQRAGGENVLTVTSGKRGVPSRSFECCPSSSWPKY